MLLYCASRGKKMHYRIVACAYALCSAATLIETRCQSQTSRANQRIPDLVLEESIEILHIEGFSCFPDIISTVSLPFRHMMLASFLLFLLHTLFTSLSIAAPPQSITAAAPPPYLNNTIICGSVPYMGVIPSDCTYLLNNLDEFADWPREYLYYGGRGRQGLVTPVFVQESFCRVGVLAISPEQSPVERFRLKDYMDDLRRVNQRCILDPMSRWNAGKVAVGTEGRFYAYLGGVVLRNETGEVAGGIWRTD